MPRCARGTAGIGQRRRPDRTLAREGAPRRSGADPRRQTAAFLLVFVYLFCEFVNTTFSVIENLGRLNPLRRSMFRVCFLFCIVNVPDCHTNLKVKINKKPCINCASMLQYNKSGKRRTAGWAASRAQAVGKPADNRGVPMTAGQSAARLCGKGGMSEARRGDRFCGKAMALASVRTRTEGGMGAAGPV